MRSSFLSPSSLCGRLSKESTKYVRIGFDTESKEIGLEFLKEDDNSGELMKLTYTKSGTGASCAVRSLITYFSLNIKQISGIYKSNAIEGPKRIEGFADNGFILKVEKKV